MIPREITPGGGLLASFYARDQDGRVALGELTGSVRARVSGRLAQYGAAGEVLEDLLAASLERLVVGAWHSREPDRPPLRGSSAARRSATSSGRSSAPCRTRSVPRCC